MEGYEPEQQAVTFQDSIATSLYKDRVVLLYGEVSEQSASLVIAELKNLSKKDPKKPIELDIMSGGGDITAGLAIVDQMMEIQAPIITVCKGFCASMAAVIFSSGDYRLVQKHGFVLIHQGRTYHQNEMETVLDADASQKMMHMLNDACLNLLADNSGKTYEQINADTQRDNNMSAEETVKYGLADAVMEYGKPLVFNSDDVSKLRKRYVQNAERKAKQSGK
jgi:ATP-dependent Clp protease protease subunit